MYKISSHVHGIYKVSQLFYERSARFSMFETLAIGLTGLYHLHRGWGMAYVLAALSCFFCVLVSRMGETLATLTPFGARSIQICLLCVESGLLPVFRVVLEYTYSCIRVVCIDTVKSKCISNYRANSFIGM